MADQQKDAPMDNPVPEIQAESSSDDSSPEDTASISEKAIEGGESSTDSPKPYSPFSGADSPDVGGAVGGAAGLERSAEPTPESVEELAEKARRLQIQASALDKRGLHSGKVDVFKKFFNHENLEFCTRPEGRHRRRAERQRHCSEGGLLTPPESDHSSMVENLLGPLQVQNPEPLLNQAGALVGMDTPADEFANLRGNDENRSHPVFGALGDPQHSVSSAPTVPIVEAYTGNYSPEMSSEVSDRGMGSGSSFPSFPSRPETASDSYALKISPLPDYLRGTHSMASPSSDSDILPPERPVRRRRSGATSNPMAIPARSKSVDASTGAVPKRKISKDSSVDSGDKGSSEDEHYPELLCQSVESESLLPIPDITAASECLLQGLDALSAAAGMVPAGTVDAPQNIETEESESEPDPASVVSCSPDTAKETEHPPRKDDA